MLFRFSLYGFLKNQRYFEPFLVLVFLEKGMNFAWIGLLFGFREFWIMLLEIPSGAVADVLGRKKCMILSFSAYIFSFVIFGLYGNLALLFVAMFLFAIGESFRTGTHKAMIFSWLRNQNRTAERVKVYGYTRSWSKLGSAASVILAAVFVFTSASYANIFYLSIIPYFLGILNFLGYPDNVDGERRTAGAPRKVSAHLWATVKSSFQHRPLRQLIAESMGYEGVFQAVKDYLQPVLKQASVLLLGAVVVTEKLTSQQQSALLIGPAFLVLYLLSALASRYAHRLAETAGGEDRAASMLWWLALPVYAGLALAGWYQWLPALVVGFILLYVFQNLWRPILIARFDSHSAEDQGATILSIESQARRFVTMLLAPLLGMIIDQVKAGSIGGDYWPIGVLGVGACLLFVIGGRRPEPMAATPNAIGVDAPGAAIATETPATRENGG